MRNNTLGAMYFFLERILF